MPREVTLNKVMIKKIESIVSKWEKELFTTFFKEREFHKTRGENSNTYERTYDYFVPSRELLCLKLGVAENTIKNWERGDQESMDKEIHARYLRALETIRLLQKTAWENGSAQGKLNPTIAKLILMNNHGMKEKTDHTTNDEAIGVIILPSKNEGTLDTTN